MNVAIAFPPPDPILEASGDSTHRRAQRANRAAQDVLQDRRRAERQAVEQLTERLTTLQDDLKKKLLVDGLTDFARANVTHLAHDVDRMLGDTQRTIAQDAKKSYTDMADLGESAADEPMRAAQLRILPGLPGLDPHVVNATFDNTLDLLTQPMQQFGTQVKIALRGVALAGDNKFEAIARLRDQISGAGFDGAQFRAERIIRTELGRVFNLSTFRRLVNLAKDFPFLRKGWRAAGDNRTRAGHVQAGRTYGRGSGIAIEARFQIQVWDERPGAAPKLLGTATLMFPIDPAAEPAGRLAAGATIMCRCNAFVDFDMGAFAQFTAQAIQKSLGGPLPPTVPPPARVPAPAPKPKRQRAVKPKPAVEPTPPDLNKVLPTGSTNGPRVSAALKAPARGPVRDLYNRAMAMIDKVHSDGDLFAIPLKTGAGNFYGQYRGQTGGVGVSVKVSKNGLSAHPINTLIHETGHWLDHQALNGTRGFYGSEGTAGGAKAPKEMADLKAALKNSRSYQQMVRWSEAASGPNTQGVPFEGDGTIPKGLGQRHLRYLRSTIETFARSYAQYVTIRSGDQAGMDELRRMQKAAAFGPVKANQPYNYKPMGTEPTPDSWDYPTTWEDDDFEPIAAAFDRLFEAMGWRHKAK